jgi:hypothetical protein
MFVRIAGQLPAGVRVRGLTVNGSPAFSAEVPIHNLEMLPRWVLRMEPSGKASTPQLPLVCCNAQIDSDRLQSCHPHGLEFITFNSDGRLVLLAPHQASHRHKLQR